MALLTAEDVLHKNFKVTKGGYDQNEVDDYLDEVSETLRTLEADKAEVVARLAAAELRVTELDAAVASLAAPSPVEQVVEPVSEARVASGLLELAQKLHDDFVRAGHEQAHDLLTAAQAEAERLVSDAQAASDRKLGDLEQESADLQSRVDDLRAFEVDYRERLRSHLQGLLVEVAGATSVAPPQS